MCALFSPEILEARAVNWLKKSKTIVKSTGDWKENNNSAKNR